MDMDMGSMDGSMSMANGETMPMNMTMEGGTMMMDMGECMTAMLWNWNTIDSCFLAESWRIKSSGMFAGSCIGVIALVVALELLRRLGKENDRWIVKSYREKLTARTPFPRPDVDAKGAGAALKTISSSSSSEAGYASSRTNPSQPQTRTITFRPTLIQQGVRATLHMAAFAVAYLLMLIIMSFNGYIFICAMIGAWIGFYMFHWDGFSLTMTHDGDGTPAQLEEKTLCCG